MLTDPRVSACIVLYKTGMQVMPTVKCVKRSEEPVDLFIVDNSGKKDRTGDTLGDMFARDPYVTVLKNKRNLGFGRGHNQALPKLKSAYHIIMNPDVTFSPELIGEMVRYMDEHRDICLLTPRVLNTDGSEQFVPRRQPTLRYMMGGVLGKRFKRAKAWREEYTRQNEQITEPTDIDFATGCFMFIRTSAFRHLRGFDPHFFLYMEDCDLSRRAAPKYGRLVYHPDLCVTHGWARADMHSPKALRRHLASAFKFFVKWGWEW